MKASHILVAAVLALGVLAGPAHASVVTTFVHDSTRVIDGTTYYVYHMIVQPTVDWQFSELEITLSTGHFYNHSLGIDREPTALLVSVVPELEWDTYATTASGGETETPWWLPAPGPQFGQNTITLIPPMGNTVIAAGWGDTTDTGPGTFKVAQVTMSSDAEGTISGRSYNKFPGSPVPDRFDFGGSFGVAGGGDFIPEPATLSLLAVAPLAAMRRRRRRAG